MSRATSIFVATSLALAVVTGYLWYRLNEERALTERLREQAKTAVMRSLPIFQTDTGPAVDAPVAAEPAAMPAPQAVPTAAPRPAPIVINPVIQVRSKQDRMQLTYPDLAQQMGLSPEQAEALFDFLQQQQANLSANAIPIGTDGQIPEQARRVLDDLRLKQKSDLQAYLGPAGYEQWKQYEPTLEARRRISELTAMVASSGEPITEVQKQPLLNTILAEQQRRAQEEQLRSYPSMDQRAQLEVALQNLKGREESYQRVMDSAKSYLTPVQFETMKASMQRQIDNSRMVLNAQLAQLDAGR